MRHKPEIKEVKSKVVAFTGPPTNGTSISPGSNPILLPARNVIEAHIEDIQGKENSHRLSWHCPETGLLHSFGA